MYIKSAQVNNYKSYSRTPELSFGPGFNVIIGKNSAGKSALLEALSFQMQNVPHRSLATPAPRFPGYAKPSYVDVVMACSGSELEEYVETPGREFFVAAPDISSFELVPGFENYTAGHAISVLSAIRSQSELQFAGRFTPGPNWSVPDENYPSLRLYHGQCHAGVVYHFLTQNTGQISVVKPMNIISLGDASKTELGPKMLGHLATRVYAFSSNRLNSGSCPFGTNTVLRPDAVNLAEVLSNLQSANPGLYSKYNKAITAVIPQVKWVAVENAEQNTLRIKIWQHSPDTMRKDLSIPLSDSGSGVGQVLAMLYVAMTEVDPRTIIIDEPQTFLHPGALRKLLEILSDIKQHQFVLATHSPSVLSSVSAKRIYLLEHDGEETSVQELDVNEVEHARLVLAEVGASWADVFGADSVLWVEGPTEEQCFPLIIHSLLQKPLQGRMIKSLINTGDLTARHAKLVMEIYQSMSHSNSVLPPTVGFLLDDECRKQEERDNLRNLSGKRVYFIERRMYENYLLDCRAVAFVLSKADSDRGAPIAEQDVEALLCQLMDSPEFYPDKKTPAAADRLKNVHAGRILERLFATLTGCRVSYTKTEHGVLLTRYLLENDNVRFRELADALNSLLFPAVGSTLPLDSQ